MPEAAWAPIDRLVYYVLFPALLVRELAAADLAGLPGRAHGAWSCSPPSWSWRRWRGPRACAGGSTARPTPACCSAWCAGTPMSRWPWRRRWSPPEAMPLVALAVAVMVPAANVMSVAALARHGSAGPRGAGRLRPGGRDQPADPRLPRRASRSTCGGLGLPALVARASDDPGPGDAGARPAHRRRRAAAGLVADRPSGDPRPRPRRICCCARRSASPWRCCWGWPGRRWSRWWRWPAPCRRRPPPTSWPGCWAATPS